MYLLKNRTTTSVALPCSPHEGRRSNRNSSICRAIRMSRQKGNIPAEWVSEPWWPRQHGSGAL